MRQVKNTKIFIFVTLLVFLMASVAHSQAVVERYKLGHLPEGIAFVSEGKFAGKFAFADGWNVYLYDINTGTYDKLFCQTNLNLGDLARGICFISAGDFAGNFLLGEAADPGNLFIVSFSGTLIAKVGAVDFEWDRQNEGITQITSGPYQGKFAIICFKTGQYIPHIFIFRIENTNGIAKAYLEKDIATPDLGTYPFGLGFLPDDYPDPAYRNHLVISDLEADPNGFLFLRVFDCDGILKAKFPVDSRYEGLAYINRGPYRGKLMVYGGGEEHIWVMSLDGSEKIPFYTGIGIGLAPHLLSLAWLEDTNQFLIGRWLGEPNNTFYFVSRLGPGNWRKDDEIAYSGIPRLRDITGLTPEENYYLLGIRWDGSWRRWVQKLDSNFYCQGEYPIWQYSSRPFGIICDLPGDPPETDKFLLAALNARDLYLFNKDFSSYEIIDLSAKVNGITDICYDAAIQEYYLLDSGSLMRAFDSDWNEIDQCDVSNLAPRGFSRLAKITSGDLKDNFALLDQNDLVLVIINFAYQKAASLLEGLIEEIQITSVLQDITSGDSGVEDGLKNSLIYKLKNAINSIENGNINAAIWEIEAFQDEVQAQKGKKIPLDLADQWIGKAEEIVQDLRDS